MDDMGMEDGAYFGDPVEVTDNGIGSKSAGGRTFDRVLRFDPASLAYRATALEAVSSGRVQTKFWPVNATLDQGQEGACVGFAWTHWATADPMPYSGLREAEAQALYRQAQRDDQFPGEDYDGSSVLGGAKAARSAGYLSSFYWARSMQEVALSIANVGPVVIGVDWFESMFEPSPFTNTLRVAGKQIGGHATLLSGVEVARNGLRRYQLWNSWGPDWGQGGWCWISEYSLYYLLIRRRGEACLAVKVAPSA